MCLILLLSLWASGAAAQAGAQNSASTGTAAANAAAPAPRAVPPSEPPIDAAGETPLFRAGVTSIRTDVLVTNNGAVVTDLTKDDFIVYDEGVQQAIKSFGREREPLSLLLLLDISGSMKEHIEGMAAVASRALRYLRVGDRAAVMPFARKTAITTEFTGDLHEVAEGIRHSTRNEDVGSATLINEAIIAGADYLNRFAEQRGVQGRRAILMVTDNFSMNYRLSDEQVIRTLDATDIVMNAIVVGKGRRPVIAKDDRPRNPDFTPADVFKISEATGGEAITSDQAQKSFSMMMERIRQRYAVYYDAPEGRQGTYRRVRVELSPEARQRYPQALVKARAGYFVR